jgi:hypothetical protein
MSVSIVHRHLLAGQRLTVTADSVSSGSVVLIENGAPTSSPVAIVAGATRYFGPFPAGRDYRIITESGSLTISQSVPSDPAFREAGSVSGAVGNLTTIPAGRELTLDENAQSVIFGSLTVNGSYTVNGELYVRDMPA